MRDKDNKIKEKYGVETGFFEDGLPYARMGNKPNLLVNIEHDEETKNCRNEIHDSPLPCRG